MMNEASNSQLKLWLNNDWYIPIYWDGYCAGTYYEGALGIVIQLKNNEGGTHALKIPRLMADTPKENAYICQLLIEEAKYVNKIFTHTAISYDGLLVAVPNLNVILSKPVNTEFSANSEAHKQHGQIIALQFKKGKAPRFSGIKKLKGGKYSIFPEIEGNPIVDEDVFSVVHEKARSIDAQWENIVVVVPGEVKELGGNVRDKARVYNIRDAFQHHGSENHWYVGVPAVGYHWGISTLQHATVSGKCREWQLSHHLDMVDKLLSGLISLHRRGFLHTDIRPANVMHLGEASVPKNYNLIDYAGYNISKNPVFSANLIDDGIEMTGHTIFGPSIGRERNSPFYAPERRTGIEKESADTAVILKDENGDYRLLLGWRTDVVNDGLIVNEVKEKMIQHHFSILDSEENEESSNSTDTDLLLPGDRIQIREYIFQIKEMDTTAEGEQILLCSGKHWKIYHGRIVIVDDEPFFGDNVEQWISIPRIIELRQWSVATDLYGIGALFLYTLFHSKSSNDMEKRKTAESDFHRVLSELESVPYFQNMWAYIGPLCAQLDSCFSMSADQIKNKKFIQPEQMEETDFQPENINDNSRTLIEQAEFVTDIITTSVQDTRTILENLGYNYVYFIYSIYFALCCLHRKTALPPSVDKKDNKYYTLPFCDSRVSQPEENENFPARVAQKYIGNLKKIVDSETFKSFTTRRPEGIERTEDMPASILRRENFQLRNENDGLRKTKREIREKLQNIENILIHEKKGPLGGLGKGAVAKIKEALENSSDT